MTRSRIPAYARATAEATLAACGTATRTTDDYVDGDIETTTTTVWAGSCTLLPASSHARTMTAGDDRIIGTHVIVVPIGACWPVTTSGDPDDITTGDTVTIDDAEWIVRDAGTRTNRATRRLGVVAVSDAEAVPR